MTELPLYMIDAFGRETGLVLGVAIGFAFGFVLERSGFGRANILAGGDSAGRAIVLGAVLGAAYGVPETWCRRTRCLGGAERLLKSAP